MQEIAALDLDGYAIGGRAVGEPKEEMYRVISVVEEHMPKDKIRYLMGCLLYTSGRRKGDGRIGRRERRSVGKSHRYQKR